MNGFLNKNYIDSFLFQYNLKQFGSPAPSIFAIMTYFKFSLFKRRVMMGIHRR